MGSLAEPAYVPHWYGVPCELSSSPEENGALGKEMFETLFEIHLDPINAFELKEFRRS